MGKTLYIIFHKETVMVICSLLKKNSVKSYDH